MSTQNGPARPTTIPYGAAAWMQRARRIVRAEVEAMIGTMPLVLVQFEDNWWLFAEDVVHVIAGGYVALGQQAEIDVPRDGGTSTVLLLPVHEVLVDEFVATITADGYAVVKMNMNGESETITRVTRENAERFKRIQAMHDAPEGKTS